MEKIKSFLFNNLSPRQTIIKNAFWLYLSEVISKGLRLIIFLLVARNLGPTKFGIFEYLYSFIGVFFLVADFGISNILIREYQQREDKRKYLNNAFSLKLALSLGFALISIIFFPLSKKSDNFLLYFLIVLFYFLSHLESFFESYFLAIQKTEKRFIFNLTNSILIFLIIIFGLKIYQNVLIVVIAYLSGMFFGLVLAYLIFLLETKQKLSLDFSLTKYYLTNGLALSLFGILGYVFFGMDKIFLAHFRTLDEVAYYSTASRIIGALMFLPSLFGASFYPYLAQKAIEQNSKSRIFKKFYKLIFLSLIAGFSLSIIIYFSSYWLILFLFGEKYLPAVDVLRFFIWILVFLFPVSLLDLILISYHKQWLDFVITLIPAMLNLILNFIFVPLMGMIGAALASILSQILNFVLSFVVSVYVLKKS
ncbi:MAG: polysaccharide biosynthesis protein [Candidatus Parcubacteria bacterium]|nr:MAG: polysaccharide biosynthesis protein [Candidatus Parcubacteria bacterium]